MNTFERMYKVLTHDGKSAHGGEFDWNPYLPKYKWDKGFSKGKWIPGKWLPEIKSLEWCNKGYHLTSHPLRWKLKKGRIFIAEHSGEWIQTETTDKACFSKVRLIAELGIDSLDLDVKIFKLINSFADLRFADLRFADLRFADLSFANLSSADLSYANLSYANLSSADLSYANLSFADLSYANLSSADLRFADLRFADLSFAVSLEGCYIDKNPNIAGYKFENGRLWSV